MLRLILPIRVVVLFFSIFLIVPINLTAQPNIQGVNTGIHSPEELIREIFQGEGVEIISVNYQGALAAIGSYNNLSDYIPIEKGMMITTGSAALARNANLSPNAGTLWNDQTADVDLSGIASDPIEDVAFFEISFIPHYDHIAFKYAFASEEYPEYACTDFNDVFGFFLSGPNPTGGIYNSTNIAWVPDPSDPSGLTLTNIPVSINSINSNGIIPGMGCDYDFSQYHNVIANGDYPTYDGYIDPFWAIAEVIPCESYTMKIGIADVSDDELDSAIFLEGKSFGGIGPSFIFPEELTATYLAEGCDNFSLLVQLPFPLSEDYTFDISIIGAAINGTDILNIPNTLTIPAGTISTTINIVPIDDGVIEGIETIGFVLDKCKADTLWLSINDQAYFDVGYPDTLSQCSGPIQITGNSSNSNNLSFSNTTNQTIPEIFEDQNNNLPILASTIEVTGLPELNLTASNINKICIDLDHEASWQIDLYLRSPYGKIIELSSRNGTTGNDYMECCFSPSANSQIDEVNSPFIGEYLPEEPFSQLNELGHSVNGTWALLVKDNTAGTQGILSDWSLEFNTAFAPNFVWTPSTGLSCSTCPNPIANPGVSTTYSVTYSVPNGCAVTNEVRIERELPTSQGISTAISCPGDANGYITVAVLSDGVAPFDFDWGPLGNDSIVGPLAAGAYTVTIIDSNGCTGEQIVMLNDPDSIQITFDAVAPCSDMDNSGSLTALPSGGQVGYEFLWNINSQTSTQATIENLSIGTYSVTVSDDLGCTVDNNYTLTSGDFEATLEIEDVTCFGDKNGRIIVQPNGGSSPFEFLLNGISQGSNNQFTGLGASAYELEIFDNNGCSITLPNIYINQPDSFSMDLGPDLTIFLGEQPSLDIDITNGQGDQSDFLWNWKESDLLFLSCATCTTPRLSNIEFPRTFDLTLIDTAGCRITDHLVIAVDKPRRFFVPTGFTPNGDQLNDLLLTHGDELATVELFQLYDRWGALVFQASEFKVGDEAYGWDGKNLGDFADPGVYVWIAQVRFVDGVLIQYNGESTLIR